MRKINIILSVIFCLTFLFSCKVQELKVDKPQNLQVKELNLQNVKFTIDLPIENPNDFSFNVKRLDINLYVNGKNVGKLKQNGNVKIKAKCKQDYPVAFEVTTKEAVNNVLFLVGELQKRNPDLRAQGSIKVSKFGISKKIKVDHTENLQKYF
ncbi:MAG: LEA type 2 family protein [Bacteroidales bacterium]|jgi:LEA14-like dessication related protein|nr:LEA type 2 family protein [Bacteroidales bacterium]HOL97810.1 LEA type 2 family protein [Bacteroidales bacterium]HOM35859.1 LEA type 2 family protein [Bacteroidales bacterium]HPD23222.1 LEA type 2 family protein [Bacteroidales bacterium]HRS99226.1 LEA type 2 family protein [Bacteroidales bacterium]